MTLGERSADFSKSPITLGCLHKRVVIFLNDCRKDKDTTKLGFVEDSPLAA